jgi:hypothetical protein
VTLYRASASSVTVSVGEIRVARGGCYTSCLQSDGPQGAQLHMAEVKHPYGRDSTRRVFHSRVVLSTDDRPCGRPPTYLCAGVPCPPPPPAPPPPSPSPPSPPPRRCSHVHAWATLVHVGALVTSPSLHLCVPRPPPPLPSAWSTTQL